MNNNEPKPMSVYPFINPSHLNAPEPNPPSIGEYASVIVDYCKDGDQSITKAELYRWTKYLMRRAITEATQGIVAERDELKKQHERAVVEMGLMQEALRLAKLNVVVHQQVLDRLETMIANESRLTAENERLSKEATEYRLDKEYILNDRDALRDRLNAMVKELEGLERCDLDGDGTLYSTNSGDYVRHEAVQAIISKYGGANG